MFWEIGKQTVVLPLEKTIIIKLVAPILKAKTTR